MEFLTVATDYGDWETELGDCREDRMDALLSDQLDVIVSGTVANQSQFYDRLEHAVLLSASIDVLIARGSPLVRTIPTGRCRRSTAGSALPPGCRASSSQ